MEDIALLHWMYAGVLLVFGLAMGSFLNVVAYRTPMGISIIAPPSACPKCGKRIAAYDNVPLLGWLWLGGKCRNCRAPISARYPLVELATGVLWALSGWRIAGMDYGYWQNVFMGLLELAFVSAMVVTVLVDWDFQIILDEISLGGLAIALVASALLPQLHMRGDLAIVTEYFPSVADLAPWIQGLLSAFLGAQLGLAVSMFIHIVGTLMLRKQIAAAQEEDPDIDSALGFGDVKLMMLFGAFMGWKAVLFIFVAGCVIGSVVGSVIKVRSGDPQGKTGVAAFFARWSSGTSVLPFGPFLVAGALLYLYQGPWLLELFKRIFLPYSG